MLEAGAVTATHRSADGLGLELAGASEMIFAERVADADDAGDDEPCAEEGETLVDEGEPCVEPCVDEDDEFCADEGEPDVELDEDDPDDELAGVVGEFVPDEVVDESDGDDEAGWLGSVFELDGAERDAGADAGALDEAETNDTHRLPELIAALRTTAAEPRTEACAELCAPIASRTPPPTRPTATARTCTKHIKDRPVLSCSSGQYVLHSGSRGPGRPEVADSLPVTPIPYNASYACCLPLVMVPSLMRQSVIGSLW
jgi:hypothetical protein